MAGNPFFRKAFQDPANKEIRLTDSTMRIVRKSPATGKVNFMVMQITTDQWNAYQEGMLIQRAFPQLNASEREFIMSGYFGTEFEDTFKEED